MRTFVATLWKGDDLPHYSANRYGAKHVEALWRGIKRHHQHARLILLVDDHHAASCAGDPINIRLVPFRGYGEGGWTPRFEAFLPSLWPAERYVMLDLDVVITGNLDWLFEWNKSPVGLPSDPYHPLVPCSTVISYDAEGAELIWDRYVKARAQRELDKFRLGGSISEMVLLREMYKQHGWRFLEDRPTRLISFKRGWNPTTVLSDVSMVYFHGSPKPWDLPSGHPVRKEWER